MAMALFDNQDSAYTKLVDRYSRYIESPILRLKFLNSTLTEANTAKNRVRWLGWVPYLNSLKIRAMLVVEVAKLLPPARRVPFSFRVASALYRLRLVLYGLCVVMALG